MNQRNSGIINLALLAALIATLCDQVHVTTATLYYPNPCCFGQPWWSLPGFFVAFTAMGIIYLQLAKWLPAKIDRSFSTSSGGYRSLTESMLIFALVYILSGFGNESPALLNLLFYGSFLLRLAVTQDKGFIVILSMIIGVGGVLGEGILSALDLVSYTKPVIFHVPVWLAALYFHGAFALRDGMRFFVYGSVKCPTQSS